MIAYLIITSILFLIGGIADLLKQSWLALIPFSFLVWGLVTLFSGINPSNYLCATIIFNILAAVINLSASHKDSANFIAGLMNIVLLIWSIVLLIHTK